MAGGRPSDFTQEIADLICGQLASGLSMRTVCKAEDMPDMTTVFRWIRTNEEFRQQYEKAKEECADALAEEMLDIADDGTNDWMERIDKDGMPVGYVLNGEHVQRSRLRLDARKWIASKLKPKKYGDKITNEHTGKDGGAIKTETVLPDSDREIINRYLQQKGATNDKQ